MTKRERAIIGAVIDELIADDGNHIAALERLCRLIGRPVRPIDPGAPVTVLEVAASSEPRRFNQGN